MKNVSVILPVYNSENTLNKCINSLLNLNEVKEIIIIDDGSNDKSVNIIKNFNDKKIILIFNNKNIGTSKSKNKAAKLAKKDILFFAESDAYYDKNYLNESLKKLKDKSVAGTIGQGYNFNNKNLLSELRLLEKKARAKNYKPKSVWVIRKKYFYEIGGYDENLVCGEDIDLGIRLKNKGYKLVFAPKAVWYHKEPETLKELIKRNVWQGVYCDQLNKKYKRFEMARLWDYAAIIGVLTTPLGVGFLILNLCVVIYLISQLSLILKVMGLDLLKGLIFPLYLLLKRFSVSFGVFKRLINRF